MLGRGRDDGQPVGQQGDQQGGSPDEKALVQPAVLTTALPPLWQCAQQAVQPTVFDEMNQLFEELAENDVEMEEVSSRRADIENRLLVLEKRMDGGERMDGGATK